MYINTSHERVKMVLQGFLGTPCPVQHGSDASLMSNESESTFNFTSAFRSSLAGVKPRRPRTSVAFTIHDENSEQDAHVQKQRKLVSKNTQEDGRRQPRRPENPYLHATSPREQTISTIHPLRTSRLAQAPKRPMNRLSTLSESPMRRNEGDKVDKQSPKPVRQARRGTIYIPSEDTTMPSMYMGIFSPIKHLDGQLEGQNADHSSIDMTGIAGQMAMKRANRKSIMGAAPRRAPLQASIRTSQDTATVVDRYGQGGGKENVPPGLEECEKLMLDLKLDGIETMVIKKKVSPQRMKRIETQPPIRSNAFAPTASSLQRANPTKPAKVHTNRSLLNSHRFQSMQNGASIRKSPKPVPEQYKREVKPVTNFSTEIPLKPKVPSRFVVPVVKSEPLPSTHALLSENITKPDMYEDNWLSHQEIAITQLINSLFNSSKATSSSPDQRGALRQQLLNIYGTDTMVLMYKRLNAALLYGALGVTQEVLDQGDSWYKDLGRKQQFLDLWLQTYDLIALEIALEVVVGRQCKPTKFRVSSDCSETHSTTRKPLQSFIEMFLLRNEDGTPSKEATCRASWSYQRTLHRSIMLIKALDLLKTSSDTDMSTCLFQPSSTLKSSSAVVRTLFQMLNTSAGDPLRALSHLNYHVTHIQLPLEEYDYRIDNLAIDLRDGTRLTRLVELLLYPSTSQNLNTIPDPEATTTVLMPEGETIDFQNGSTWPLSRHLRFPCQARAPMLWNVQIALSAIQGVRGMKSLTDGISAEDIVDGYREKTIRLLWALVGKWGLSSLLDCKDLEWEIRRLLLRQEVYRPLHNYDMNDEEIKEEDREEATHNFPSFAKCKFLLKQWAHAIVSASSSTSQPNLCLKNFTTSFADGKIFEAIVNEYEGFILPPSLSSISSPSFPPAKSTLCLQIRLQNLGCSTQFSDLFPNAYVTNTPALPYQQHIFSSDFVFLALTFLAARLLPPSKKSRAAIVIQRRWRRHWCDIIKERKKEVKNVLAECAVVAAARDMKKEKQDVENEVAIEEGKDGDKEIIATKEKKEGERAMDLKGDIEMSPMSPSEGASEMDIWLSL